PTLKIWMTPLASVAMLEKLALLKMASWRAPVLSRASCRRTSAMGGTVADASNFGSIVALTPVGPPWKAGRFGGCMPAGGNAQCATALSRGKCRLEVQPAVVFPELVRRKIRAFEPA